MKQEDRLLLSKVVTLIDIYLEYLSPEYTNKIEYWNKQKKYAKMLLDNNWIPTVNQLEIIKSNTIKLEKLIESIAKES